MTQIKPPLYKIPDQRDSFYAAEDLKIFNPMFFEGTSKGIRKIIEKKSIPESEILFAIEVKNKLNVCTASSKRAKLFISKNWAENNFFKRNIKKEIIQEKSIEITQEEQKKEIKQEESNKENEDEDSIISEQNYEVEEAPNKVELDDEEKFKDSNGNIIEIETRGERDRKKIFFKVKDIMNGFGMQRLNDVIFNNDNGYERNKHFITFKIPSLTNNGAFTIKKTLFLTYKGLLRVLFVSRNKNAESFQDWAEEKLFTMQMGTYDKKEELGCEILNIDVKAYRAVFKNHATDFPCIYLLKLGTAKDLRSTFNLDQNISDNLIIYKYGNSNNMERRMQEHGNDYGKMKNVKLEMSIFHVIDTKYLYEAETDLRQFFKNFRKSIEVEGRNELVALDDDGFKQTKNLYRMIGSDYAGATFGLQKKITKMEMEIKEIQHQNEIELMKKDMIIQNKEMVIQQKDMVIQNKELELEKKDLLLQIRDLQLEKLRK